MEQFDSRALRMTLAKLTRRQQLAFAASCCERLLPNYAAFSHNVGWGDAKFFRRALDLVWSYLAGDAEYDSEAILALISECDLLTPDTEDFTDQYTSPALDAATALIATLRFMLTGELEEVVNVATYCRDTVYMFGENRNDSQFAADRNPDVRVIQDALMQRELRAQSDALTLLLSEPDLPPDRLTRLRSVSYNNGVSNIGVAWREGK